jgi:hypothetical protein
MASIVISGLTALPFYGACGAVVESHSMPGHYLPLVAFSYLFWIVLIGAGLGEVEGFQKRPFLPL